MILVTGASGNVGGDLVPQLLAKGKRVRVLVRDPKRVTHLPPEVERVVGDLSKPETLTPAFVGVRALFLMTSEDGGTDQVANAVAAAKAAHVAQIVYLSSLSAARPTTQIGRWHRSREQAIEGAEISWTFLRPGAFMSNALQWRGQIKGQGTVFMPHAERQLYLIDSLDMAAVAAVALTEAGHAGKAYPLTGDEGLTGSAQVAVIGRVLERPLTAVPVTMEQAREGMKRSGMPPVMVDAVAELVASDWDLDEGTEARTLVRRLTGRPPSTFEAWVKRHAKEFR